MFPPPFNSMAKLVATDKETVDRMISIPKGYKIDLGDGRTLYVRMWKPTVSHDSLLSVEVEAIIGETDT